MYFNNRENGRGKKVMHKLGYVFEGSFKDGLFHGMGKQYFTNGDYYVGEFNGGLRNGKGTFKFANGDEYEGEWVDNDQNGHGVMKSKYQSEEGSPELDSIYTGVFKEGLFHGKGSLVVKDGFTYTGDFTFGFREGQGMLRVPVNDTKNEYFKEVGFEVYEG